MNLPCIMPSGVFGGGKTKAHMQRYSKIIHVDIDGKIKANRVLSQLDLAHVLFFFRSPRKGVKIGFLVSTDERLHKWTWERINEAFCLSYGDPSSKAINKQSSLSWDKDAYLNLDAAPYTPPAPPKPKPFKPIEIKSTRDAFNIAEGIIKKRGLSFRVGSRNQYIFELSCILNRMGLDISQTAALMGGRFGDSKMDKKEIWNTVKHVYRDYADEHGKFSRK